MGPPITSPSLPRHGVGRRAQAAAPSRGARPRPAAPDHLSIPHGSGAGQAGEAEVTGPGAWFVPSSCHKHCWEVQSVPVGGADWPLGAEWPSSLPASLHGCENDLWEEQQPGGIHQIGCSYGNQIRGPLNSQQPLNHKGPSWRSPGAQDPSTGHH